MKLTNIDFIIFILMYIVFCWGLPFSVFQSTDIRSLSTTLIIVHIAFAVIVPLALYMAHIGAVEREAKRAARQNELDAEQNLFRTLVLASKHLGNLVQICQDEYPPEECDSRGITAAAEYQKQLVELATLNAAEQIARRSNVP